MCVCVCVCVFVLSELYEAVCAKDVGSPIACR